MWETIGQVLSSDNGIVLGALAVGLFIVCSKYGLLKVKTDKITIGKESSETERTIMRNQIEYVEMSVKAFEQQMSKPDEYDEYRGKYITERVFDEIVRWIAFNHIRDDKRYIRIKQVAIWNLVQTLVVREEFQSEEFRAVVYGFVEEAIKNLVAIRKEYS